MIQIIGIRSFIPKGETTEKKYDKIFEINPEIKSVKELFENIDTVLEQIPQEERWNIFYTVASCHSEEKESKNGRRGFTHRVFDESGVIAFDFDGVQNLEKYQDAYIEVISSCLGIDSSKTGIVASGNGLHFLIAVKHKIENKEFYKKNKQHYKAICSKLNKSLEAAGLPGKCDTSVFESRRILRLPGTINRKPNKPEKPCSLINPIRASQNFSLKELSGLPDVKKSEQIDAKVLKKYSNVDPKAVVEGCSFLKHAFKNPNDINEPQWYAALSITARLNDNTIKDGYEWSHELSKGHRDYNQEETDEKIEQALAASGPRTCTSIDTLWDGCKDCPNYQKVTSPILLRGKDTIPTEHTGFHNIPFNGKGKPTPNYKDLREFFERKHPYLGLAGSGMVHTWRKTHYEYFESLYLDQFSQEHFNPYAKENMRREFRNLVRATNLRPMEWWDNTTKKKINFQNGYFDINTREFRPHDKNIGFRYVLPYEYDENAKAPVFQKMLDTVTGEDEDTKKVLLEFMGYALSNDDCWAQKCLLLTGEGANGKSTFINVLCELAGEGNYSALSMEQINKSEYNRQMLDGKLFNVSEETPTKALLDNSLFKSLITGGEIQVRSPYKEPYFIKNRAKMIFTCNELPGSSDNTYGFYRRLLIVPFDKVFTKDSKGYDPHIGKKLSAELPGIFNLAIRGYYRLVENQKFTDCKKIKESIEQYEQENDTVLFWAKESMVVYTNGGFNEHFAPIQELYDAYKFDTERQGRKPVTFINFSRSISRLREEIWGGISYQERYGKKTVELGNRKTQVRGLRGIGYQSFS